MPKITKRLIDALSPGGERLILLDSELKGFGLVALPSGVRSFIVQYRNASGRKRRLTLGRFGVMTADGARQAAREALAAVGKGLDPIGDKEALRAAPSVSELLDRYLAKHVDVDNASSTAEGVRFATRAHSPAHRPAAGVGCHAAGYPQTARGDGSDAAPSQPDAFDLIEGLQPRRAMGRDTGGLEPLPHGAPLSRKRPRALPFG